MRARELKIRRPKPGEREAFDGAFCLRPPGNPAGFQAESFLPVDKPQFVNGLGAAENPLPLTFASIQTG